LVPRGAMDWVVGAVVVLRGLLINALLFLGLVLLACSLTAALNGTEDNLGKSLIPIEPFWISVPFFWTGAALAAFILVQLPPVAGPLGLLPTAAASLKERERIGTVLAWGLLVVVAVFTFELQTVVLRAMFDAYHLKPCHRPVGSEQIEACLAARERAGWLGRAFYRAGLGSGAPWLTLFGAIGTVGAFGEKLLKLARTSVGDRSWPGLVRFWSSHVVIAIGALVVPAAIWTVYLSLS
ncbi:hypothetical protein I3A86_24160, partial [Salmonella enterica]|nr:hypothetical protein [Salmonella enterica]